MDIYKLPVFPPADLLEMMPDDELAALSADISKNGLRYPIVVGNIPDEDDPGKTKPMLIDGRNRRAACKLAGIDQADIQIDWLSSDEDPLAYVNSMDSRRDLTKSQRAMLAAKRYPEPAKTGRGKKSPVSGDFIGVTQQRLSEARKILKTAAPDVIKAVLHGHIGLDKAGERVSADKKLTRRQADRLARLRDWRPDLADDVEAEKVALETAEQQAKADEKARRELEWAVTKNLGDGLELLDHPIERLEERFALFNPEFDDGREKITPARIRQVAEYLNAFADKLEDQP